MSYLWDFGFFLFTGISYPPGKTNSKAQYEKHTDRTIGHDRYQATTKITFEIHPFQGVCVCPCIGVLVVVSVCKVGSFSPLLSTIIFTLSAVLPCVCSLAAYDCSQSAEKIEFSKYCLTVRFFKRDSFVLWFCFAFFFLKTVQTVYIVYRLQFRMLYPDRYLTGTRHLCF